MKRYSVSLMLTLVVFWVINSGQYNALLLGLGAISIGFVVYLTHRMDVVDHESQPFYLTPRIFSYHLWLIKEIIQSNIDVLKHIWRPQLSISPSIQTIKISQRSDMGKVIYANSITLTPGTIAVDLNDDEILVHALDANSLVGLEFGEMDSRISKLEQL
jgi:multicomponent Na+:H+ antiporter subunit E